MLKQFFSLYNFNQKFLFILVLIIIFVLDFFHFNENLLIGILFTIGFIITISCINRFLTSKSIFYIITFKNNYMKKQIAIIKMKLYLYRIIFYYYLFFNLVKNLLLNYCIKKIIGLIYCYKNFTYKKIFIKLFYLHLINKFLFMNKLLIYYMYQNIIKIAYNF